jgi:ABC-type nitrate/sulfonate/bicarbonate transport system substrate-binding protein
MKISRRHFLTQITVGVAGLSLARDFSWAQAKGKVGYMKIVDNAAMFMAMEKGFFKAEGIELETVPMAGGAVIVQGVTSGDLQFGWTNVISLYQAHAEGFDFKLIAGGAMVGNLADLGLGDIFQIVSLSRRSGTLQLTTSLDSGEIIFQQGLVVATFRSGSNDAVGEGLMSHGVITPTDYQEMLGAQGRGIKGEMLLEEFHLKHDETQRALAELLKADIYRMLDWDEGGFSFVLEATPDRWRDFALNGPRIVVLEGLNR